MSKNKVKLNICGSECVIGSDDSESYVRSIGDEVEKAMAGIMEKDERISVTLAAIITALSYCDESHKAASSADNLRSQIKDYLEDSSRARTEADESKREIDRMRREIQVLRDRLAKQDDGTQKADKPEEKQPPARPIAPAAPVQRPQTGSYSRVAPQRDVASEQESFISFFEKKNED